MRVDIITALPEIVRGPLDESIPGRAQSKGELQIEIHDLREYATGKYRKVDDYPFGGGAGMVLKPEPIFECFEHIKASGDEIDEVIFLTPDGEVFNQAIANELSLKNRLVLLAGHYKGVDQRVRDTLVTREISIGDYVLSGGELPAMVLVDAIARVLPGVLGDSSSAWWFRMYCFLETINASMSGETNNDWTKRASDVPICWMILIHRFESGMTDKAY
jgi:tRNA (guanine37-N1)-methyltransferase